MFNLIKMDIYRLFNSVSTYVLILVMAIVSIVCPLGAKLEIETMRENSAPADDVYFAVGGQEVENIDIQLGIMYEAKESWAEGTVKATELMDVFMASGFILIFVVIATAIFVNADQKNGYVKNIAGQLSDRSMLIFSKLITLMVELFILFLVFMAGTIAGGYIFLGDGFAIGDISGIIKLLMAQYMLHFAFCSVIMCVCTINRGAGFGMTMGILISSRFATLIYGIINKLISVITGNNTFDISKYAIEINIYSLNLTAVSESYVHAVVLAVVFITAAVAAAALSVKKRDVR